MFCSAHILSELIILEFVAKTRNCSVENSFVLRTSSPHSQFWSFHLIQNIAMSKNILFRPHPANIHHCGINRGLSMSVMAELRIAKAHLLVISKHERSFCLRSWRFGWPNAVTANMAIMQRGCSQCRTLMRVQGIHPYSLLRHLVCIGFPSY